MCVFVSVCVCMCGSFRQLCAQSKKYEVPLTCEYCISPQELFAAMDTNSDGRIDSQDLHNALEKVIDCM